jgi:hypothetical protein
MLVAAQAFHRRGVCFEALIPARRPKKLPSPRLAPLA